VTYTYENPAAQYLADLGLISNDLELASDRCRDAPVRVLKCRASGIFFLESAAQTADDYYSQKPHESLSVHQGLPTIEEHDLSRRRRLLSRYLAGRRWVDIGAGFGALVERDGIWNCVFPFGDRAKRLSTTRDGIPEYSLRQRHQLD